MPTFYTGYMKRIKIQPEHRQTGNEIKGGSLNVRLSKLKLKSKPTLVRQVTPTQNIMKTTDPKKVINPKLNKFIHLKL